MASRVSVVDSSEVCVITVETAGTDFVVDNPIFWTITLISFFIFFLGALFFAILTIALFTPLRSQQVIRVEKLSGTIRIISHTLYGESVISAFDETYTIDEVDIFTDHTSGSSPVKVLLRINSSKGKRAVRFPLDIRSAEQMGAYESLTQLLKEIKSSVGGSAYAPNITLTKDGVVYRRTLAIAKDFWSLYWGVARAIILIAISLVLFVFVLLPLRTEKPPLYIVRIPLAIVFLGLIVKGVHMIVSRIFRMKLSEVIHFDRAARIVKIEEKWLISQSVQQYLFEQVELKVETILSNNFAINLGRSYAVVLLCNPDRSDSRRIELVRTLQEATADDIYYTMREVLI